MPPPFAPPPAIRPAAWTDALDKFALANADFHALGLNGLHGWRAATPAKDDALHMLLGYAGRTERLLLSDHQARGYAGPRLLELFAGPEFLTGSPNAPLFFATFINATGYINTLRPQFDLAKFSRDIDRLLRDVGLEGVVAVEFQSLTDWPARGQGRTIVMNAHAVVRSPDAGFDAVAAEARMRASRRLVSPWGAPTVTLKPLPDPVHDGLRCLAYLLKAPLYGKRLVWDPAGRPPGYRLVDVSIRPDVALRLTELMSHVSFPEAVRGVGPTAAALVAQWRADLRAWLASRHPGPFHRLPADTDVAALWAAARQLNGRPELKPVRRLDRGAEPFLPPPPTPLTHGPNGRPRQPRPAATRALHLP